MPMLFFLLTLTNPVLLVTDSALYAADPEHHAVTRIDWHDEIIDQCYDGDLYLLTRRFLWRFDPGTLTVLDRALLPQRFNYLTTRENEIVLIAAEEVITMDKHTLAFKSGVGIETGDNRPLVAPRELAASGRSNLLYLASDAGSNSVIKVFNINDGRLVMKKTLPRIVDVHYDPQRSCLQILAADGRLSDYRLDLKKIGDIKMPAAGTAFDPEGPGYILYQPEAVTLVSRSGSVLDFQPLPRRRTQSQSWFGYDAGVGQLDLSVVRVRRLYPLPEQVTKLNCVNPAFGLALTAGGKSICLDPDTSGLQLASPVPLRPLILPAPIPESADSLWYFQLGAFEDRNNARFVMAEYRSAGLPVRIDSAGLYRVQLGAFADKDLGFEVVQGLNLNGWFVFRPWTVVPDTMAFEVQGVQYVTRSGVVQRRSQP